MCLIDFHTTKKLNIFASISKELTSTYLYEKIDLHPIFVFCIPVIQTQCSNIFGPEGFYRGTVLRVINEYDA